MKSKIVILTYSLGAAGAERMAVNLVKNLDKNKYDVSLVLMNTDIEYEIPENLPIHFIEKSNRYESEWWKLVKIPVLARRFAGFCNRQNIDAVISIMNRPNFVATMAKLFRIQSKILISERCYTPFTYNNLSVPASFKLMLLKWLYKKADIILPNSRLTEMALRGDFNIENQYQVIKNPTDVERIEQLAKEKLPREVDFSRYTFINAATFRKEKNQRLLIEAAAMLTGNFQLLLLGKGPDEPYIKQLVHDKGLTGKVIFLGFDVNPYRYMARANCFVLSSLSEGFPNILIESMICKLPVISVDCKSGPRELLAPDTDITRQVDRGQVEVAEYGILCADNDVASLANAMQWALQNQAKMDQYKEKASQYARQFDMQQVCASISAIVDNQIRQ